MRFFIDLGIFALCLSFAHLCGATSIKILLRFDDVSATSELEFESRLFEVVRQSGGQLLVGVIPFRNVSNCADITTPSSAKLRFSEDRISTISSYANEGGIKLALHGCNHVYQNGQTAFTQQPLKAQRKLLRLGREFLYQSFGVQIDHFVPSRNSYDLNTLRALELEKFSVLSASVSKILEAESPLQMIPGTTYPQNLKKKLTAALREGNHDAYIVVTMHPYDFSDHYSKLPKFRLKRADGYQLSLAELQSDLEWITNHNDLTLARWDSLERTDFSPVRMQANADYRKTLTTKRALLPTTWKSNPKSTIYYTLSEAKQRMMRQTFFATCLYVGLFIISYILAVLISVRAQDRIPLLPQLSLAFLAFALTLLFIYADSNGFYMKAALLATLILGMMFGFLSFSVHCIRNILFRFLRKCVP